MNQIIKQQIASWLVLLISTAATVASEATPVEVYIEASASEIIPHDPVIFKVSVRNTSQRMLHFNRSLGTDHGSVLLEARRSGSNQFVPFESAFQGVSYGLGDIQVPLPAEASCVCYEWVASAGDAGRSYVFSQAGTYEVRARLTDLREMTGISETITVQVRETPDDIVRRQYLAAERLRRAITLGGLSAGSTTVALLESRNSLGESHLRKAFEWVIAIAGIRDAPTRPERRVATEGLRNAFHDVDVVEQEFAKLVLARECVRLEEFDTAQKLSKQLADAMFEQRAIAEAIRTTRENRGK
ncbi:MAG: hypothetical protein ABI614_07675 [Planctomycetota bacterium]